jgi:hypothetical protein
MLSNQPVALDTLVEMLGTIMTNPNEPKYRKVFLTNKAFLHKVGRAPGAIEFLKQVGFKNDEAQPTLSLRREDVGLLWMGKSILEGKKDSSTYMRARDILQLEKVRILIACAINRTCYERTMCC